MIDVFAIKPVPKPRMTQRDKWAKRPAVLRYRAFCDEVRANEVKLPEDGSIVTFVMPMPKSWSKKKKDEMDGAPHQQKPDLDNLVKALGDACYTEDCKIHCIAARKVWGVEGQLIVRPWTWGDPWPEPVTGEPL